MMENPEFDMFCELNKCWMMRSACEKRRKIIEEKDDPKIKKNDRKWSGVNAIIFDSKCMICEQILPEIRKQEVEVVKKNDKKVDDDAVKKICVIDGCEGEVKHWDMCNKCYQGWYRGKIEHPVSGAYISAQESSLQINLAKYKALFLPMEHVLMHLAGQGIARQKK